MIGNRWVGSSIPVSFALIALIGLSNAARASTWIEVLLSADTGAPTAEEVVEWAARGSPDAPPLASLEVAPFERVEFLIPEAARARGDFKELLDRFPESPAARLQRFIVVEYGDPIETDYLLAALRADRHVLAAAVMETYEAQSAELISFGIDDSNGAQAAQWHLSQLRIPTAWTYNPGHALVALLDLGLQWDHPNLRAFDGTTFVGGNFLTVSSLDFAYPPNDAFLDDEVDEKKPIPATHPACDRGDGFMVPSIAGHGTHTAGLVAAHPVMPGDVTGVCRHCGLYMMKVGLYDCLQFSSPPFVTTQIKQERIFAAAQAAIQVGAQIVNMSINSNSVDFCDDPAQKLRSSCLVLEIAKFRDTLFVSSSGNRREALRFPASHPYVVAAGGVFENGSFWDESPGDPVTEVNCPNEYPYVSPPESCGSNFSQSSSAPRQELVAGARDIVSTFYTGAEWNRAIRCTDESHDVGTPNNGVSPCTGTSMSSPIIAGVFALLRSTNPLVTVGDPLDASPKGLRYVVATTTDRAQASLGWNEKYGYGKPDATAAIRVVMGRVSTAIVRNRATPLFAFYGSAAEDHTYTTSPQKAVAFTTNQSGNYTLSVGTPVPGYPAFPPSPGLPAPPAPKAIAYVMTTPNQPNAYVPPLVPLYQMDIVRNWPLNCTKSTPGCNTRNRDFLLATDVGDLEDLKAAGYRYFGREGYIYQRCTPEPACIPQGAEPLWRKCKLADDDCAVFLERDREDYEDDEFTVAVPSGSNPLLGYAYPAIDTDGDGLVDGFERVVGTRHEVGMQDSDNDGQADAMEFPMIGISNSDPCSNSQVGWVNQCPGDVILRNGFDGLSGP